MLDRGAASGAAPPAAGDGAAPETSGTVASTAPPTSFPPGDPSAGGNAAPSPTFDGKTLELAEDSYADLGSGKVDDDELFRREADSALRSLEVCVRSTRGRMFLLQVEQIPTHDTQPPVLILRVA